MFCSALQRLLSCVGAMRWMKNCTCTPRTLCAAICEQLGCPLRDTNHTCHGALPQVSDLIAFAHSPGIVALANFVFYLPFRRTSMNSRSDMSMHDTKYTNFTQHGCFLARMRLLLRGIPADDFVDLLRALLDLRFPF